MYMLKPVLALPVVYSLIGRFICFLDIACSSTFVLCTAILHRKTYHLLAKW